MAEIEVWVLVDENGDYGIGQAADGAAEHYADNIGSVSGPTRMVKVVLQVPLPVAVELTGTVPAEPEGAELRVA